MAISPVPLVRGELKLGVCQAQRLIDSARLVLSRDILPRQNLRTFLHQRKYLQAMSEVDSRHEDYGPVDHSVLSEMCGGDEAFERRILGNFMHATRSDAGRLREVAASGDIAAVGRVSHSIKGASRTIGAQDLADVCDRIERAARAADANTVAGNMPDFDREIERVYAYLESTLGPHASTFQERGEGSS
jgi:HPt (histidine-containing phosphotransfer) domain-containing protein